MLHIIDQFPVKQDLLATAAIGDTVVFTENAVYAVKQCGEGHNQAPKTFMHINLCVRKTDLVLRNISRCDLCNGVCVLDDNDYQSILVQEPAVRSWN